MDISIGSNTLRNTNGLFTSQDREVIQVTVETDQQLNLTMELYNPTGTQVAKLERNAWVTNDQDRFELRSDTQGLTLIDKTLKGVVIQVQSEGEERISVPQAKFYLPDGVLSEVTAEWWRVGNKLELKGTDVDLYGGAIEVQ